MSPERVGTARLDSGVGVERGEVASRDGVAAVAGVDDLEPVGCGVEVSEAQQGDGDAGPHPAVPVAVAAVGAAPDVDEADADRGPMAQLARRKAEFVVANMRVDWAASTGYAAGASAGPFHEKTLCLGMPGVKVNSLIEIPVYRPRGRLDPAGESIARGTQNGHRNRNGGDTDRRPPALRLGRRWGGGMWELYP
jgi:hypothetical protein